MVISSEDTYFLVDVTRAPGVDLHFHLGSSLKLVRLQQRYADLIVWFGYCCLVPGESSHTWVASGVFLSGCFTYHSQ